MKNIFFLFLAIPWVLSAQELPPIENYSPKLYGAENQNWSISQSDEKYIFVANNSGLLEFNGSKWRLYPTTNNTILRSVNASGNRIYTGAYMEFGYWERNEFGSLKYSSLSDKLKEPLIEEDFWNIIKFDDWVLFQSLYRIYIYNTIEKTFEIITSKTRIPKVFKVDNTIYFQKMNEGIFKIENGIPVLVSNSKILKTKIVVNIFKIDKRITYQTQEDGFFYFNKNELLKWNISTNDIISKISVYSSVQLSDGSIVLGSISNGIFHLDKKGDLLNHINQEKGLNNNTILSMFEDVDHNLWLGLDNGISVVNLASPFMVYNDSRGKLGSTYASIIFNEFLYLGTNQGLFYKKVDSKEDFKFISGTEGQVWCFKNYDNTLFCGHDKGTFIVSNDKVNLITNVMGTMEIKSIKGNDNLLIQGFYNGLSILEKKNGSWQFRNVIKGFTPTSRYFNFTENNTILVNHEYKGVFKLKLNDDFTEVLRYNLMQNIPKGLKSATSEYNGELLYTSNEGIFKYQSQSESFKNDSVLTSDFLNNDLFVSGKLVKDVGTNTLWGFTKRSIVYFSPGKLDNVFKSRKIFLPASLRRDISGFENMLYLKDKQYLFGTSRGYMVLDLDKLKDSKFHVTINSIQNSILDGEKNQVALNSDIRFDANQNNLFFTYSVPEYEKFMEVNYQYKLEGLYDELSEWSIDSEVAFKNLPYGDYTFGVTAKIGNQISENVATYSFTVNRPWYISNLLIAVYLILCVIMFYFIHLLYRRYYNKQKNKLVEKEQRIFAIAQLENEQVIMKLKNEKLQDEIQSKTRELSSSTMNIIKKNEILNAIKDELGDVKNDAKIKPVIKIINKNLTNTGDWNMFQEAFNNADSDFLKKIKTIHPNLTPNDLRLCAYLRVNLSSKEIAPLLNISPRSVEIKRYRLRKKIELLHGKSLVEYIMEV